QSGSAVNAQPNETWARRRIVTLQGLGDYFVSGDRGQAELIKPDGLGVNIVVPVQRLEGDLSWIKANGAGDVPVRWVNNKSPFLFLRRGRSFRTMKACPQAAADFEKAANLKPTWAELYNQATGVYVDCPDPAYRNPEKAVALIEHAVALDVEHPTYLTVLALAYFRSGQLEKAVVTQRQALESPKFPPGYREEATAQLREYERALTARRH